MYWSSVLRMSVPSGAVDVLVDVGDDLVGRDVARRDEEPQLVSPDRPAHRGVEILDVCDAVGTGEVLRAHFVADVVALPVAVRAAEENAAADAVAAVLGDHVRAQTARLNLRRMGAGADRHLRAQRVVDIALLVRGFLAVHAHAVDVLHGVLRRDAMATRVGLLHLPRPANVRRAEANTRHHHADRHDVSRRGKRVDEIARQHLRACGLRDVDQRCLARYCDRLFKAHRPSDRRSR